MNSQRYKWDDETKDDGPSEFATTSFSTTAGAMHSNWSRNRRRRRAARRAGVLWTMLAAVGASALVLYGVAHWLRH